MVLGVLALQGAFIEHQKMFKELGVETFQIRNKDQLKKPMDGIVLPGGESTTMYRILRDQEMVEDLKSIINSGLPTFGTCAGLLLLAKEVDNYKSDYLQTMNIEAKKNAYGRQLGSFKSHGEFNGEKDIPFIFIRAPYIVRVNDGVEVLSIVDDKIVAAKEKNQLVTAFHPELTDHLIVHKYFIDMIKNRKSADDKEQIK
ncbi:MAG TPA: pyridoxal 5'-phosphate synthase glutaminase subunit PdxT [Candidatus Izemoplasmatales bacterium]|nr:pyridoxal 5'-phosphate synthase glutaminase subunit PdxT [Candidatus Izemoplasmatales bacterium]